MKEQLQELADEVRQGARDRADAAVIGQLLGALIRAIGMELKIREQTDLEQRLEELEETLEAKQGQGRYGA